MPLARRIEDPYQRLVEVPDRLRSTNATASFRFNLDAIARADLKTRAEAYNTLVTSGVMKPNEARAKEDLPPIEGGDVAYMQQQMVPLGTRPEAPEPPEPDDDDTPARSDEMGEGDIRRLIAEMVPMGQPSQELAVRIDGEAIRHDLAEMPPPVVNVAPPEVHVEPPIVNVSPPEVRVEAPIVNIPEAKPPVVDMTPVAEAIDRLTYVMRPRKRQVVRDHNGRITGITEE